MRIKPKVKTTLFVTGTVAILAAAIAAGSTISVNSRNRTNLDNANILKTIKDNLEAISTKMQPLETTLTNRMQKPQATKITSLKDLDDLVSGNPFSAANNIPDDIQFKAEVGDISAQGVVKITLSFSLNDSSEIQADIFLKGFIASEQSILNNLVETFAAQSPLEKPLSILSQFATQKPLASSLTTLKSFDDLVISTPFKNALGILDSKIAITSTVGGINERGEVKIVVVFSQGEFTSEKATIVINGFTIQNQAALENLANRFNEISPKENPLVTSLENKNAKPLEDNLVSLESLDNLVNGKAFSKTIKKLPAGVSFVAQVSEISTTGIVEITLTLSREGLNDVNARIYLGGFIPLNANQLSDLVIILNAISNPTSPLNYALEDKKTPPQASLLTSISALDNLVNGNPFSMQLASLPQGVRMQASVSAIDFNRQVKITLRLSKAGLEDKTALVVLQGFEVDPEIIHNELLRLSEPLEIISPINSPLNTTLEDKNHAPSEDSLQKIADLDNLVQGNPFSKALEKVPKWLKVDFKVSQVQKNASVYIDATFSDKLSQATKPVTFTLEIGGFINPQDTLDNLSKTFNTISPSSNPLFTSLVNIDQKPDANFLNSLSDLDALVTFTPFRDHLAPLPLGVKIQAQVDDLAPDGSVKITITFTKEILDLNNQKVVLSSQGSFYLKGFASSANQEIQDLARNFQAVSPQDNPLITNKVNKFRLPNANLLTTISSFDALVASTPFQDRLGNLPLGVTMTTRLSDKIDLDGTLSFGVNFTKEITTIDNQKRTFRSFALFKIAGFIPREEIILERFVNRLSQVSPQNKVLSVKENLKNARPSATNLTSLESLDAWVNGSPFQNQSFGLPRGTSMSAKVKEITFERTVAIELTFTYPGLKAQKITIYLGNFNLTVQESLGFINNTLRTLVALSPERNPLNTTLENKEIIPSNSSIHQIRDLDNLVAGTPFTNALGSLPRNIALSAFFGQIDHDGSVEVNITLVDNSNGATARRSFYLKGFTDSQVIIDRLQSDLNSLSSANNPLKVLQSDPFLKPAASSLNTLNDLDNLVSGTPFSDKLISIPNNINLSASVAEVDQNGALKITITFSKLGYISKSATVYLNGYEQVTQRMMDDFVQNLASVSTQEAPLSIKKSLENFQPDAFFLTSLASLDNLVEGKPFEDKLKELPLAIRMHAQVEDIDFSRQTKITLFFNSPNLNEARASIYLQGFKLSATTLNKMLTSLSETLAQVSPEYNALSTTLEDKSKPPASSSIKTLEDLDNLVAGTPFSDAIGGKLPDGVGIEFKVLSIFDNTQVRIAIKLYDIQTQTFNSSNFVNFYTFINGFDRPTGGFGPGWER